MDSPQFDGQLFQLGCTNLNKGLAGYPGVVAEFVHPVPVGGVYTQLLHQLQADAAFPSQFLAKFLPPFVLSAQFLQSSTTNFILLGSSIVTTKNMDYIDAANSLKSGDIDAFFCTAGLKTTIIDELSKECDIRIIPIDDTVINKMLTYSSSYSRYTIPAGTYKGQDEDINTIGVKSVLITSDSISEALVKQLTQMLFKKSKELQYSTSLDLQIDEKFATDDITIPFHSGAESYYKEKGINLNTQ